jgi:riboflavin kinase / FMN adenylyltransferase
MMPVRLKVNSMQQFIGKVVQGSGRGTVIGTPTINIQPTTMVKLPPALYIGYADIHAGLQHTPVMIHIGMRPTFNDTFSYELHCINTVIDTHEPFITVYVVQQLRDIQTFPSAEALQSQIAKDIALAKTIL